MINPIASNLKLKNFPTITRDDLKTLQVNIGYKCNQACSHCHVNAGPNRTEMMTQENIKLIPRVIDTYDIKCLDITGGAPELHPAFRALIVEVRKREIDIIDRCNLTILSEPGQESLSDFLAKNKVTVTASLPCYLEDNVDSQRGSGVFNRSIEGLKRLNAVGYGIEDSGLELNLVYNPQGNNLPPPQFELEKEYRKELHSRYGIMFNRLFTITNMPIQRFANMLQAKGLLEDYQELLKNSFNHKNMETVMCRSLISIDWKGFIYDCDFNQQLGLNLISKTKTLKDLLNKPINLKGKKVNVDNHCFGCTAGNGSSCSGALNS